MIDKKLINAVSGVKKYIFLNVLFQWIGMLINSAVIILVTLLLGKALSHAVSLKNASVISILILICILLRAVCTLKSSEYSHLSACQVKVSLRDKLFRKIMSIGAAYTDKVSSSEVTQVSVEGINQLEVYFGAYLPQLFYSVLAPITLFAVLSFINLKIALILLACVPLIPISIMAVQKLAKRIFSGYWNSYTSLGDTFLENIQGFTLLKTYQADEYKNIQMNNEAEKFRKITMKVLYMQLNSITIMDLIAFGGTALGLIMALNEYAKGNIHFTGCLAVILLAADFFIPMRQLGSYFHIAMNGLAAGDKIFRILNIEDDKKDYNIIESDNYDVEVSDLYFSYNGKNDVLRNINMNIPHKGFVAITGESGCGKSTLAGILSGRYRAFKGNAQLAGVNLSEIFPESIMAAVTYISFNSRLFKGSMRENLLMGNPNATDEMLWDVLTKAKIAEFVSRNGGLDMMLDENGSNLSGGQRQKTAFARAVLHDTPIYIFDEASSNIDVESENDIIDEIYEMAHKKTIIFISHRLRNIIKSDKIYVMSDGTIAEEGTHEELLRNGGTYSELWERQNIMENFVVSGEDL